jgi:4-amino-4-deoxy-L-arabinose transferase-like glycosyltransferase
VSIRPRNPTPSQADSGAFDRGDFALALCLAIIAALVILPGLGARSLANWDEAIYGVVTRGVLSHPGPGLRYGERLWFEKPPLAFWLMATSSSLFGLTEFALRLPSALFGIGAIVLQYLAGRRLGSRCAGVAGAALLLGVPQFVAYSRLAMTDVPLATLGMLSVLLLLCAAGRPSMFIAAGAAFGLAVMTKSVAAFLFAPGLLCIAIAQGGLRFLGSRQIRLAAMAALAVALPWHVWAVLSHGREFIDQYFGFHVMHRFLEPLEGHLGGRFYYLDTYFFNAGYMAPLHVAGVVLALGLAVFKRDRLLAAITMLPLGAFMIVSLQGTKIGWYLTPVCPGAALAAALAITAIPQRRARAAVVALVALIALPGILYGRGRFVEHYDILDFSPEVRSLKDTELFARGSLPMLYTLDVATPAPLFYLAHKVRGIDGQQFEILLADNRSFFCLTFKSWAKEFARAHPGARLRVVAATQSLAVIAHP